MKIEEGMYVRTEKGEIKKVFQYNKQEDNLMWCTLNCHATIKSSIVKSSYNIIDLIEVGDYVNGLPVVHNAKNNGGNIVIVVNGDAYNEEEIKSIVTKEQFNSMKYEVGE